MNLPHPKFGHPYEVFFLTIQRWYGYTFILVSKVGSTIGTLLIVDDNERLAKSLKRNFELQGHTCVIAASIVDSLVHIENDSIALILLDIRLGGESGLDLLDNLHERGSSIPVVIITGNATLETAIGAIRKRVIDYIRKPIDFDELYTICRPFITAEDTSFHSDEPNTASMIQTLDPTFRRVISAARKIAKTDIPILITGESGTGKELLADYIHHVSNREALPMYKVNCASLPESLLESELFGHTRGAFTGATKDREGIFEKANGSTLFLDEIGDMPVSHQAKILRVLQNKEVRRVGGSDVVHVDVRFMAATNKSIEDEINRGTFRGDLYYRLNAGRFHIPPLRERIEDIPVLAEHFARMICNNHRYDYKSFSDEVISTFLHYDWPGNVRELKNVVQYAFAISEGETISADDLPGPLITGLQFGAKGNRNRVDSTGRRDSSIRSLDETECDLIKRTLITTRNNKKEAARILRISRSTLYEKIKKFGLENERFESINTP